MSARFHHLQTDVGPLPSAVIRVVLEECVHGVMTGHANSKSSCIQGVFHTTHGLIYKIMPRICMPSAEVLSIALQDALCTG